jgi:hypothetical protein
VRAGQVAVGAALAEASLGSLYLQHMAAQNPHEKALRQRTATSWSSKVNGNVQHNFRRHNAGRERINACSKHVPGKLTQSHCKQRLQLR